MPQPEGRADEGTPPLAIDLTVPWVDHRKPDLPPMTHLEWAENIARLVAVDFGLRAQSPEGDDVVQVAHLVLTRIVGRFDFGRVPEGGDPDGQFRGLAWRHVRKECEREARRIRAGGLLKTSNDSELNGLVVRGVPDRCSNCAIVTGWGVPPAFDDESEEEEPPPLKTKYEPTLVILRNGRPAG